MSDHRYRFVLCLFLSHHVSLYNLIDKIRQASTVWTPSPSKIKVMCTNMDKWKN